MFEELFKAIHSGDFVGAGIKLGEIILKTVAFFGLVTTLTLLGWDWLREKVGITEAKLKKNLPLAAVLFLSLMLEQVWETRTEAGKAWEKTRETEQTVLRYVGGPKPMELRDVVGKIEREIDVKTKDDLTIRQIALDMKDAWGEVNPTWIAKLGNRPVHYQLLILTEPAHFNGTLKAIVEPWRDLPVPKESIVFRGYPGEVLRWCVLGKPMGETVIPEVLWKQSRKHAAPVPFTYEIKQYSEVPFVHGFKTVSKDFGTNYRMAFCRWTQEEDEQFSKWEWGKKSYQEILSPQVDNLSVSHDLALLFDGYFDHLWKSAPYFRSDKDAAPSPRPTP